MPNAMTVKAIKPKPVDEAKMWGTLISHAVTYEQKMLSLFERTTATWEHDVKFELSKKVTGRQGPLKVIEAFVTTDDPIYRYVDQGTKPHIIRPKRAKRLAFPSIFSPKTLPKVISSREGQRGPQDTFALEVHHPGTKARQFTKTIKNFFSKEYKKDMQIAFKDAAKASGHGIK